MPATGFAIAGTIAVALAFGSALPLSGEASEWARYLLLGAVTPLAVLWLARDGGPRWIPRALAVVGTAAALCYVAWSGRWIAAPLAAAQVVLAGMVAHQRPAWSALVAAALAWAAVMPLTRNFDPHRHTLSGLVAGGGFWALAIDAAVIAWVTGSLAVHERARANGRPYWRRAAWLASVALLALESFRVDYLFDWISAHHWGLFVAPAETVRQGGWLLWDTPATYGPGAILTIAAMPTTTWDGFFWLNALACFVSAALLLGLLRERMNGVLALAVALCAVFWLPGAHHDALGGAVLTTPNAAPFRFVWCQLLLVIAAHRPRRPAIVLGTCVLWLVGCLWSFESAVYCSAAWLPAYVLLVWDAGPRARIAHLAVPPVLLAGAAASTFAYYAYHLGHGPDWYGYVEAVLAVGGRGVWAKPVDVWGPVAVLLLVFWITASTAMRVTANARSLADAAPTWAALSLLWAVTSYFIARSHPITVTNLLPTILLVSLIALREPSVEAWARAVCTVLLAAVLILALHDHSGWASRDDGARRWALRVTPRLPTLGDAQLAVMKEAGIRPGDAIAYFSVNVMPGWPPSMGPVVPDRVWLPIFPLGEIVVVTPERRSLYVERFTRRTRSGGWLLMPAPSAGPAWLVELLAPTHRVSRMVDGAGWRATYYEFVGQ